MTEGWGKQAACRDLSAEEAERIFFPPEGQATRSKEADYTEALAFCARCPVREECLTMALDAERGHAKASRHGMFGGKTPRERWMLSMSGERTCEACGARFLPRQTRDRSCSRACSYHVRNASDAHKEINRRCSQDSRDRQAGVA